MEKLEHPDVEKTKISKNKKASKEQTPAPTMKGQIVSIIDEEITGLVMARAPEGYTSDEIDAIVKEFVTIIPFDDASQVELRTQLLAHRDVTAIVQTLQDIAHTTYAQREETVGKEIMREIEIVTMLQTIDELWMDHLDAMDNLRDGIWLRGDKQASEAAYKKEAFEMFERLIQTIDQTVARKIFRMHTPNMEPINVSRFSQTTHQELDFTKAFKDSTAKAERKAPTSTQGTTDDLAAALAGVQEVKNVAKPGVAIPKVGRNDPCPCGSGKKYKKCHGAV